VNLSQINQRKKFESGSFRLFAEKISMFLKQSKWQELNSVPRESICLSYVVVIDMEAANPGAGEAGGESIELNIVLPFEQCPNAYITPDLCFQFHYFAIRKMHFLMRAKALLACPGGFGTLDELFEALTLIKTGKVKKLPIMLMGEKFWRELINFDQLVELGLISESDLDLFVFVEMAEQALDHIKQLDSAEGNVCI